MCQVFDYNYFSVLYLIKVKTYKKHVKCVRVTTQDTLVCKFALGVCFFYTIWILEQNIKIY